MGEGVCRIVDEGWSVKAPPPPDQEGDRETPPTGPSDRVSALHEALGENFWTLLGKILSKKVSSRQAGRQTDRHTGQQDFVHSHAKAHLPNLGTKMAAKQ